MFTKRVLVGQYTMAVVAQEYVNDLLRKQGDPTPSRFVESTGKVHLVSDHDGAHSKTCVVSLVASAAVKGSLLLSAPCLGCFPALGFGIVVFQVNPDHIEPYDSTNVQHLLVKEVMAIPTTTSEEPKMIGVAVDVARLLNFGLGQTRAAEYEMLCFCDAVLQSARCFLLAVLNHATWLFQKVDTKEYDNEATREQLMIATIQAWGQCCQAFGCQFLGQSDIKFTLDTASIPGRALVVMDSAEDKFFLEMPTSMDVVPEGVPVLRTPGGSLLEVDTALLDDLWDTMVSTEKQLLHGDYSDRGGGSGGGGAGAPSIHAA